MKHKLIFLILLGSVGFLASCRAKLEKAPDPQVKREFGVNIQDKALQINESLYSAKFQSTMNQNQATVSTYQILSLANSFLESGNQKWQKAAYSLAALTQKAGITATVMNTDVAGSGNPYVEQAYSFVKPDLINQYSKILVKAQLKVEEAANQIEGGNIDPSKERVSQSQAYLQNIIDQLNDFNKKLALKNSEDVSSFLKPVMEAINKEYIKPLADFMPHLVWKKPQRLDAYLQELQAGMFQLPGFSEEDKKSNALMLEEAIDYGKAAENITDTDKGVVLIIDMWMNRSNRTRMPRELNDSFHGLAEKAIVALATDNKPLVENPQIWEDLKNKIKIQFENEKDKTKSKIKDFSSFSDEQLLAFYTSNKSLLSDSEWQKLNADKVRKMLLSSRAVNDLAYSLGSGNDDLDKVRKIVIYWMNLRFRFSSYPDSLFNSLMLSDEESLEAFKSGSWKLALSAPLLVPARIGLKSFIQNYQEGDVPPSGDEAGIKNYKSMMANKIYSIVDKVLKNKVQSLSLNLKSVVKKEVVAKLEKQSERFPTLVFAAFEGYAKKYLNEWFFESATQLPLLESSVLSFTKNNLSMWNVKGDLKETSSHALGAGIQFNNLAIKSFPLNAAGSQGWSKLESKYIVFQGFHALSKLSAIAGYLDYNLKLTEALMAPIIGGDANSRFEINKVQSYNPLETTFAVNDKIYLQNHYKANNAKIRQEVNVSVSGQMELLKAYSATMGFTKPWAVSHFDFTLTPLKVKEFASIPGIKDIFSKPDLFNQSLGLSLSILKNIQSRMVGVVTEQGIFVPGTGAGVKDARGAALVDYDNQKMSSTVWTKDIALSLITLTDFVQVASEINLERYRSYVHLKTLDDEKDPQSKNAYLDKTESEYNQLSASLTAVKELIAGLALFATGRLMEADGGFVTGFNFSTLKSIPGFRKLEDQLSMEKALILAGRFLGVDMFSYRAVDNFFFLNQKFWSQDLGFYKDSEEVDGHYYQLRNVVLAYDSSNIIFNFLGEFTKTNPQVQSSMEQIKKIRFFWESRLLSKEVLEQESLDLIYPHTFRTKVKP